MANLHKTERKLPWRVRDGGLPSDWLGGRIGGKFFAVKLVWHARHSSNKSMHTHTLIHPPVGKLKFAFYYCTQGKEEKKQLCPYMVISRTTDKVVCK